MLENMACTHCKTVEFSRKISNNVLTRHCEYDFPLIKLNTTLPHDTRRLGTHFRSRDDFLDWIVEVFFTRVWWSFIVTPIGLVLKRNQCSVSSGKRRYVTATH